LVSNGPKEVGVVRGSEGGQGDALQVADEGLQVLVEDQWMAVQVIPVGVVDGMVNIPVGGRERGREEGGREDS